MVQSSHLPSVTKLLLVWWGVFIYLYMGLYIVLWGMGEPAGGESPPLSPYPRGEQM